LFGLSDEWFDKKSIEMKTELLWLLVKGLELNIINYDVKIKVMKEIKL